MASVPQVVAARPASIGDLERQWFFRVTLYKRTLLLTLAVLLDLLVLGFVMALHVDAKPHEGSVPFLGYYLLFAFDSWQTYFWLLGVLLVQIGLGHYHLYKSLEEDDMVSLFPEDKSGERTFGGFTGKQLADMVHELARAMEVGPVKRIVVNDRPDPNAYTAHVFGIGNIVVLHSNLLEILPPKGVRAVVAHEVGHIRRKDSLVYLLASIPKSFAYMLGAIILWKLGVGIFFFDSFRDLLLRIFFVYLVWQLASWLLGWLNRVGNLASQQSEHLADAYAAGVVGWQDTLNALLLLNERCEVIHTLQKTLARQPHLKEVAFDEDHLVRVLKRLPPGELDDDRARLLAPRLYIEERLAELQEKLCVPLTDEEIVDLAKRADRVLQSRQAEEAKDRTEEERKKEQEEKEKEAQLEKLLVDWRKYDWDRSGHLDAEETAALVKELRDNVNKMIFRQFLEPEANWQSHPTMRGRLLYLFEAFEKAKT